MARSLISFPRAAMVVPDGEREAVGRDSHAVIDEAKAAGVDAFGGGIDEEVPTVLVSADGRVAELLHDASGGPDRASLTSTGCRFGTPLFDQCQGESL